MEAVPGPLISKVGVAALRGVSILPDSPASNPHGLGLAVKIADGDPTEGALDAVTTASLSDVGVLSAAARRRLSRYLRPSVLDSHGRLASETIADIPSGWKPASLHCPGQPVGRPEPAYG